MKLIGNKIVKEEIDIEPLDAINSVKNLFFKPEHFTENGHIYESVQCSLYGDYENKIVSGYDNTDYELLKAFETIINIISEK